ncbi:MAG: primosomal protein N' [Micavibrio sp.]|nr:primosomal protein N' [Micavibrio sp.]
MDDLFQDESVKKGSGAHICVAVLVPYPVDKAYDYAVPYGEAVETGDYVLVPLGGREVVGVVWGAAAGDVKPAKIKSIILKYDMGPMPKVHRDFVSWVAKYTLSPLGFVLKMALSAPGALEPPEPMTGYKIAADAKGLTDKQRAVVDVLKDGVIRRAADIAREAEVTAGVVKTLLGKGVLEEVALYNPAPCQKPYPDARAAQLSDDQTVAAHALVEAVKAKSFYAALLDGVTGAGKTEVYFEAVAQALREDQQVLILLPEIALSNAFLDRFKARFGCSPALWHSHLTANQRKNTWRGVAQGVTKVVIGARSALFLPYEDLGLIVVDEEHEAAYKQEDGVIYHARDMAVVRAHLGKIPIALISATPSLETVQNVWEGRYHKLQLSNRYGGARMPDVEAIDMRAEKLDAQHFISLPLRVAMQQTLERGEQVLLFLNRRGYAPLTLCRSCGHRMECPRCTAWLVEHKSSDKLHCHHCGYFCRIPKKCDECGEEDSLVACGPGVERIFDEAKAFFPDANIMLLASDTAENADELKDMLSQIRSGSVNIVIGTQIIAKGHHFPGLTLVGVVDADLGLTGGELRASERVYQLLHQVAGRAGRAEKAGRVMLQSYMPDHRIIQALCDGARDAFYEVEAMEREMADMPPFSRLAGIIIAGRDHDQTLEIAKALGRTAPQGERISTFGPAPAPYARLRGKFRFRLLVRADKGIDLQKTIAAWVDGVKCPSTVRVYVDIDPQSFM